MVAIEYHCPQCKPGHTGRFFKAPDASDQARYASAVERWQALQPEFVPVDLIPRGDETDRLHRWGYTHYREMFNERQLLGLELSCRAIAQHGEDRVREALETNLSDLLRYQNMLCRYDTMALKSLDVFSVHGFPVGLVQCESNLLGITNGREGTSVGSGGWSNIIDKFVSAKEYCQAPFEIRHVGQRKVLVPIHGRAMLGFTPSEWAYAAAQHSGIDVSQGFARALDRRIRLGARGLSQNAITSNRVGALVDTACSLLRAGPDVVAPDKLHRLEKADTQSGQESLLAVSGLGVPYAMLLYERFLGRPFAGHRDSVSELVGDALESAIEDVLHARQVSYRKTRRAEKLPGFDQAPDFVIPSEYNPQVVIEAKLTEDDGTARDKVTRVQHLSELSLRGTTSEAPRFEVIACIAGRGFGVRREDMRKLLLATRGKVFTLRTLDRLVDCTGLMQFSSR